MTFINGGVIGGLSGSGAITLTENSDYDALEAAMEAGASTGDWGRDTTTGMVYRFSDKLGLVPAHWFAADTINISTVNESASAGHSGQDGNEVYRHPDDNLATCTSRSFVLSTSTNGTITDSGGFIRFLGGSGITGSSAQAGWFSYVNYPASKRTGLKVQMAIENVAASGSTPTIWFRIYTGTKRYQITLQGAATNTPIVYSTAASINNIGVNTLNSSIGSTQHTFFMEFDGNTSGSNHSCSTVWRADHGFEFHIYQEESLADASAVPAGLHQIMALNLGDIRVNRWGVVDL